jgi:predicted membrane metal-binding protein
MLQKKIADAMPLSNKWAQKIWQLSAVTLAAQITTFPISVYYFHQFPVYFLFSNLIVIPISTILLYAGLVFLIVCWIPHAADIAANVSSSITTWMNSIIQWFDQLPMSTLRGFAPGIPEVILLYVLMWTLADWLFWKKKRALVVSSGIVALLIAIQVMRWEKDSKQNLCCIHSIRNHICITTIVGDNAYIIADSALIANEQTRKFHLDNFLLDKHVSTTIFIDYAQQSAFEDHRFRFENGIIQTSEFTLGWWNQIHTDEPLPGNPDVLFISELTKTMELSSMDLEYLKSKKLIVGSPLSEGKTAFLLKNADDPTLVYYLKDGAAILDKSGIKNHLDWLE